MKKRVKNKLYAIGIIFLILLGMTISIPANIINDTSEDRTITQSKSIRSKLRNTLSPSTDITDLFTSTIYTTCDTVEKSSEIIFGLTNEIDVDNDEQTGVNGKDIRVQYYILPWLVLEPEFMFGALFTINIDRIGEEIKNKQFDISFHLNDDDIILGYTSPKEQGNEIPLDMTITALLFFNPADDTRGFEFYVDPEYPVQGEDTLLDFYATIQSESVKRSYSFSFEPAVEQKISVTSTRTPGEWHYEFSRDNPQDVKATLTFGKQIDNTMKETTFTVSNIPQVFSFTWNLTPFSEEGGSFTYQSDTMYDIDVLVTSDEMGVCKYARIKNTPRSIYAEWIPTKENGYYHLVVDSDDTDIILTDYLTNPTINISVSDIEEMDLTAFWNFTDPGDFTVVKNPAILVDLSVVIGDWEAKLTAESLAEDITVAWLTDITGYLYYDTDWNPIGKIDLLIRGSDVGIRTIADAFMADDFQLNWTLWPPLEWSIQHVGKAEFVSLTIEVFIEGQWYHIWPWF